MDLSLYHFSSFWYRLHNLVFNELSGFPPIESLSTANHCFIVHLFYFTIKLLTMQLFKLLLSLTSAHKIYDALAQKM